LVAGTFFLEEMQPLVRHAGDLTQPSDAGEHVQRDDHIRVINNATPQETNGCLFREYTH